jgi:hypothetical protein
VAGARLLLARSAPDSPAGLLLEALVTLVTKGTEAATPLLAPAVRVRVTDSVLTRLAGAAALLVGAIRAGASPYQGARGVDGLLGRRSGGVRDEGRQEAGGVR